MHGARAERWKITKSPCVSTFALPMSTAERKPENPTSLLIRLTCYNINWSRALVHKSVHDNNFPSQRIDDDIMERWQLLHYAVHIGGNFSILFSIFHLPCYDGGGSECEQLCNQVHASTMKTISVFGRSFLHRCGGDWTFFRVIKPVVYLVPALKYPLHSNCARKTLMDQFSEANWEQCH